MVCRSCSLDLDGKTPVIELFLEWVMDFSLFTPFAMEQARILLTRPVFRESRNRKTCRQAGAPVSLRDQAALIVAERARIERA
jgi:hypothetical protein